MPEDDLIAAMMARLDQATMALLMSSASVVEQHAILGDLAYVHTMLNFLGKAKPDRIAAVMEAMEFRARVQVPKTGGTTVGFIRAHLPLNGVSDVERRIFLTLAATMAGAPMAGVLTDLPDRELVAVLQGTTDRYRERLRTVPSATLYGGLVRHAAELDRRARDAREPLRSALLAVLSETAGLAANVAYQDFGRPGDASRHFGQATGAARQARDRDRLAWNYQLIALHLQYAGRPADALDVLERAAHECVREPLSLMAAVLAKEQAVNLALLGQEHRALIELDEAYWHRGHADPAGSSQIWTDEVARLETTAGYVQTLLGRPEATETLSAGLTRAQTHGNDRWRATALWMSALDAARQGEPERAAQLASESLALATLLNSVERKRGVLRPWARLRNYQQSVPAVRELGEQLRAAGLAA